MKKPIKVKDNEQPIRVIPSKGRRHKTETRVFARNIHENFCVQKGCKFRGKHSQQGVCHTTTTHTGSKDWSYLDDAMADAERFLTNVKKQHKGKSRAEYMAHLESHLVCSWLNSQFGLDELIRLRRENSLLKHKVEKLSKKP